MYMVIIFLSVIFLCWRVGIFVLWFSLRYYGLRCLDLDFIFNGCGVKVIFFLVIVSLMI